MLNPYLDYEPFGRQFVVRGGLTRVSVYSRPYRVEVLRGDRWVTHAGRTPADCLTLMRSIDGDFHIPQGVQGHLNKLLSV